MPGKQDSGVWPMPMSTGIGMSGSSTYTVLEAVPSAAQTAIYRGTRRVDGQRVIIKVLGPDHSPRQAERLQNEYELGCALNVPTLVQPLGRDTYQGCPALVLEDFGGVPLSHQLGAPMEVGRFLRLALATVEGVIAIHARNVVHRDLKPDNIIVHPITDEVKIGDLGIARPLPAPRQAIGDLRRIEGSLPYMSPEQTGRTNRAVDVRSDLYSLGVTFFEMLTGQLPFQASDPVDWVHCHLASPPPSPATLVASIPPLIAEIVLKLLRKDAEDRYQSACGLRHDLRRCLERWDGRAFVELDFALGEEDVSDRFLIPQRLYGRAREIAALHRRFQHVVENGVPELMLVSGTPGVGKSALVHELQKSITSSRGNFAEGKFDQYKRDIPYSTVVEACADLVLTILGESAASIARWRQELKAALGVNGQLIVDVIPQVGLILGTQPPVVALPPAESQNRFRAVFRSFIAVLARQDRPLALFFDDLQWADSASLALLQDLLTAPERCHLALIGAYRDNEVGPGHPVALMLDELRKKGVVISDVVLNALPEAYLEELAGDVLPRRQRELGPLVSLIEEKTAGNPFFVIQFLNTLHDEGLIEFDPVAASWRWDIERIRAKGFTDNVVTLMVDKIRRLTPAGQAALRLLACLGTSAEIWIVHRVLDHAQVSPAALGEAVQAGLLVRLGDTFRFLHDRVQEAAHSLIPPAERAAVHLQIGRWFLAELSAEAIEAHIFDVVSQLNQGAELIVEAGERERLARLNLAAGLKAKAAIAYVSARAYLARAAALLPADAWHPSRYSSTFALMLALAECESLVGNLAAADRLFDELLANAATKPDRARVCSVRIRLYQMAGRYELGLALALEALQMFGVTCPEGEAEIGAAFAAEVQAITANLGRRTIAEIADAPMVSDPDVRALIALGIDYGPCALAMGLPTMPLVLLKLLNVCLRHGNSEEACFVYSSAGFVLISAMGDINTGFELSQMSLRLNERLNDPKLKGVMLFMHGAFVSHWRQPFSRTLPVLEQALVACLEVGDFVWAGYALPHSIWIALEKGDALDAILTLVRKQAAVLKQLKNDVLGRMHLVYQQFIKSLKGETEHFGSFSDRDFDEAACLAALGEAKSVTSVFAYHLLKAIAHFIGRDYLEAREHIAASAALLRAIPGTALESTHHFFHALIAAALLTKTVEQERPALARVLDESEAKLRAWAEHCPENFRNRLALVLAERARVEGRELEAMRLYDQAIALAAEQGFSHYEALANELAARFHRDRGSHKIAEVYLRDARAGYLRWGAVGKVGQLDQELPAAPPVSAAVTYTVGASQLDLLSVIKASQAISGQIVLDDLLRKLVQVVLAQAGAQRGCVLLRRCDGDREELAIEAEAVVENGAVAVTLGPARPLAFPLGRSSSLPAGIINLVCRTKHKVLLDDASSAPKFVGDEYLAGRQPKSVLCLPILRQADVVGLLYLENNLVAGAFRSEQVEVLELLASQAAISLENTRLLGREREARAQAEEAERRAAILAQASGLLAESKDPEGVLGELGRLLVPALGRWCTIHLVREGEVELGALVHADGRAVELQRELEQRPLHSDLPDPIARVLSTRRPMMADPPAAASTPGAGGANGDALEPLGMAAPLAVRNHVLGVIALGGTRGAPNGPHDLELLGELARRMALALDHARREEFLAVAAHELNNPLSSLTVTVEGLASSASGLGVERFEKQRQLALRLAGRLRRLICELLDLTRIERGKLALNLEDVDLSALTRDVVNGYQVDLLRAGCEVRLAAERPVVGRWDASRIDQVLLNLLSNAAKFGAGKPIEISVRSDGNAAEVSITDHGVGISAAEQDRIFDRYERGRDASAVSGLGLGLYICRRIVEAHRGTLKVASVPGLGATFTLELPCQRR